MRSPITLLGNDLKANVTVPEDIMQYVDEQLGDTYTTREDYLRAAVQHYAKYLHDAESLLQRNIKQKDSIAYT